MTKKVASYRWPEIKEMLEAIQPENKCYSRVQALIRCGDELLEDHARLVKIIYDWHETHTTMSYKLKEWANKHGLKKDSKMSGGYHFATLYPTHIEEFWKILDRDSEITDETINFVKELTAK